ncbi:MAG: phosphoribosylformylglycinamidine cyclo-ligase [archaeon]
MTPEQDKMDNTKKPTPVTYKDAGVDIDAANESKSRITAHVKSTYGPSVLSDHGAFGGLFSFDKDAYDDPVLVSSADGVGTKLKLAYRSGIHDTIGEDLVNHCVNDILVMGAKPLFFLDYLALDRMRPEVIEDIVAGIARGCKANGMSLIGGETAALPGLYNKDEYDLAGFIVGAVEKSAILDGSRIKEGDVLIGLFSTGLHTNGYSLAQKLLFDIKRLKDNDICPGCAGTVSEELMKVHKSYLPVIKGIWDSVGPDAVKGMAHITGGGLLENVPRILPTGVDARIKKDSWDVPPIFSTLAGLGSLPDAEAYRTFNMGIGMVLVVDKDMTEDVGTALNKLGEPFAVVGSIIPGDGRCRLD